MRTRSCWHAAFVLAVFVLTARAAGPQVTSSSPGAADLTRSFLQKLDQGNVDEALKLWDSKSVNDHLKTRLQNQTTKLKGFGGIKRIDLGTCEQRRIDKYQKQTGEKIDIVPVEISCDDGNLLLAVFSIHQVDGQQRIFVLESLKEWGGTASLDEELGYKG
jgi:hypothetical protein